MSQIRHGKYLLSRLGFYSGLKVKFIHGSKGKDFRKGAIEQFRNENLNILIASTIADKGLDIPAVNSVILGGSGKSVIKVYQRIGRGTRPKKGENFTCIVDFIDLSQRHLAKHSLSRYKALKSEPGFKIVESWDEIERG